MKRKLTEDDLDKLTAYAKSKLDWREEAKPICETDLAKILANDIENGWPSLGNKDLYYKLLNRAMWS